MLIYEHVHFQGVVHDAVTRAIIQGERDGAWLNTSVRGVAGLAGPAVTWTRATGFTSGQVRSLTHAVAARVGQEGWRKKELQNRYILEQVLSREAKNSR